MSGDDVCCRVVFGTLVGVFVFSVMWSELLMTSAISCPLWSSVYGCQRVECAFTPPVRTLLLLVVSLHQSDPLSDTFFCDIVVNHEIIKRACLSQQRALEEMLHRLISFFTITRGVILICIFPLS